MLASVLRRGASARAAAGQEAWLTQALPAVVLKTTVGTTEAAAVAAASRGLTAADALHLDLVPLLSDNVEQVSERGS